MTALACSGVAHCVNQSAQAQLPQSVASASAVISAEALVPFSMASRACSIKARTLSTKSAATADFKTFDACASTAAASNDASSFTHSTCPGPEPFTASNKGVRPDSVKTPGSLRG